MPNGVGPSTHRAGVGVRGAALRVLVLALLGLPACGSAGSTAPTPTPVPTPVPTATPRPARHAPTRDLGVALNLPGQIEQVSLAVHPRDGWPAVVALSYWNFSTDPAMLFVRAYDPTVGTWGAAQQLDLGPSSLGADAFHGAALAVDREGRITAVWGASDSDGGVWTSTSDDAGQRWSAPLRLATGCWQVRSAVATPDGQIVALAFCTHTTPDQNGSGPTLLTRTAAGDWLPPQPVPVVAWDGALVVSDNQVLALVVPYLGGDQPHAGFVLTRPLGEPGASWGVQPVPLVPAGQSPEALGLYGWHVQGVAIAGGALFSYTGYDRPSAFSLVVRAGLPLEPQAITAEEESSGERGRSLWYAAPGYEPASDRLAAVWGCCGSPLDRRATPLYGAWATAGGAWFAALQQQPATAEGAALGLEGAQVEALVSAQAPGERTLWLAWVEAGRSVLVRSLAVDQLVPPAQEAQP
ncbi:MAG TPA: hypothetical protein VFS21_33510 [Roseiflexaceae bacterium]|nr:hypothetical protein [Roseiflexaceae bacterium]